MAFPTGKSTQQPHKGRKLDGNHNSPAQALVKSLKSTKTNKKEAPNNKMPQLAQSSAIVNFQPLSIDTTGLHLTTAEESRVEAFKTWYAKMQEDAKKGPFRFLDLPAEIRTQIYDNVFDHSGFESYNLSRSVLPAITRASKQLRSESLPRFFSENKFYVDIQSNYQDRSRLGGGLYDRRHKSVEVKKFGVLGLKKGAMQILRAAGPNAVFKDITFDMICDSRSVNSKERSRGASINVFLVQGKFQYKVEVTSNLLRELTPAEREDADAMAEMVVEGAKRIADRAGFVGFNVSELQRIGHTFRYVGHLE